MCYCKKRFERSNVFAFTRPNMFFPFQWKLSNYENTFCQRKFYCSIFVVYHSTIAEHNVWFQPAIRLPCYEFSDTHVDVETTHLNAHIFTRFFILIVSFRFFPWNYKNVPHISIYDLLSSLFKDFSFLIVIIACHGSVFVFPLRLSC